MTSSQPAPGIVGPFAGLDVPWLLRMRAERRRDHPFLIWAPFDAPARNWTYGEFHERVGALADFKVPREIRFVDEMPRSTLEKVAKAELRKMLG